MWCPRLEGSGMWVEGRVWEIRWGLKERLDWWGWWWRVTTASLRTKLCIFYFFFSLFDHKLECSYPVYLEEKSDYLEGKKVIFCFESIHAVNTLIDQKIVYILIFLKTKISNRNLNFLIQSNDYCYVDMTAWD
jgi:hypothetical protein